MKVVLCDHVEHLGERGEIVTVAAGFARNYLLPKRLAMAATPGNLRVLEQRRRVWEVKEAREVDEARTLAERLAAVQLSVTKKAGERGTLYGSVTNVEIAELLSAKGFEVDRRRILLGEPIKSVGSHGFEVKIYRDISAKLVLEVIHQNPPTAEPETKAESEFESDDE